MDFRASYGEKITGDSWLMRDLFPTSNVTHGVRLGLATNPKKLKVDGITKLLSRAIWEQNLRQPLAEGKRRHEWKSAHGFRKAFKTRAEQVMRPINVEVLMGHDIGISGSYWRPTEQEILEDYLRAAEKLLTIQQYNNNSSELQAQVTELTQKSEEQTYIIEGKSAIKDKELKEMEQRIALLEANISELSKLATVDQGNFLTFEEEDDKGNKTGRLELYHYNEKNKRVEPVMAKDLKKLGIKPGEPLQVGDII